MRRYKLTIEYDGGGFVGWQRQDNGPSVQAALEDAMARIGRDASGITAAGRTDAGVHALGQIAHVDLGRPLEPDKLRDALNFHLRPSPISVLRVSGVAPEFHARFDAIERAYLYRILNRRAPASVEAGRVWQIPNRLDSERMHLAAARLVGKHDFTSFRASQCQAKSPIKTLDRLTVQRRGDEIRIVARARSFLHHQVRNMVGSLVCVGRGKWSADDLGAALSARDRAAAGPTAPPQGLYLSGVRYPEPAVDDVAAVADADAFGDPRRRKPRIHESAVIDQPTIIGNGTTVAHNCHIRRDCEIGEDCVIASNVIIGPGVSVGDRCRIQNNVCLYYGVTLEEEVFCGPSCVFTNNRNPRATEDRMGELHPTLVKRGATIGANATILCGHTLEEFCFVAAGAVVTRDVPPHALVAGNPARKVGWVSHAGEVLRANLVCPRTGRGYRETEGRLEEIETAELAGSTLERGSA